VSFLSCLQQSQIMFRSFPWICAIIGAGHAEGQAVLTTPINLELTGFVLLRPPPARKSL